MLKKNLKIYAFTLLVCSLATIKYCDEIKEAFQKQNEDQGSYTVDNKSDNNLFAAETVNQKILSYNEGRPTKKKFYLLTFLTACTPKNGNIYLDDFFFRYGTGSIFLHGFAPYVEWGINEIIKESLIMLLFLTLT